MSWTYPRAEVRRSLPGGGVDSNTMMSRRGVDELPGPTRVSSEHRAVVASSVSLGNASGQQRIARNVASVEEVEPDLQRRESDIRPGACSSAPNIRGDSRAKNGGGASKEPDNPALRSSIGLDQDGDTRLGSFSSASSTQGSGLVGDNESRLQESGSSSSPSSNTGLGRGERSPAAKIWVMHGVMISAVEFVLTLGNAVEEGAFRFHPSGRDLIFGASTLIEAVGLFFAVSLGWKNSESKSPVSAGVPAIILAEGVLTKSEDAAMTLMGESSVEEATKWLGFQGYLVFFYVAFMNGNSVKDGINSSEGGGESGSINLWDIAGIFFSVGSLLVCILFFFRHYIDLPSRWWVTCFDVVVSFVLQICFFTPFIVEIWESVLLFSSASSSFSTYTLAILNLAIIAPAAYLLPSTLQHALVGTATAIQAGGDPSESDTPSAGDSPLPV